MPGIFMSTKAKINDVAAAREIVDDYFCTEQIIIQPEQGNGQGTLWMEGEFIPRAIGYDNWPDNDEYPTQDEWNSRVDALLYDEYDEKSVDGVAQLLLDLAPYLETPLKIVAYDYDFGGIFYGARSWTVRPGAESVEIGKVDPIPDEEEAFNSENRGRLMTCNP